MRPYHCQRRTAFAQRTPSGDGEEEEEEKPMKLTLAAELGLL